MELNRQEQSVLIGTFISMLGKDIVNERIDKKKLEGVVPSFNEMEDKTTPKQRREAMVSVLNKTMDDFLGIDE
ncbi:hypothetical protein ACS2QU_10900 [Bacillus cereus group sp. Bce005]|uniref:hypothetical protein n=1 Tax=Bacillus cereus group sp. Bce005 TaxID=3445256 RepID=UPI003BB58C64